MTRCSIEARTRKYVKGYGFLTYARNLSNKHGKKISDFATKKLKQQENSFCQQEYNI